MVHQFVYKATLFTSSSHFFKLHTYRLQEDAYIQNLPNFKNFKAVGDFFIGKILEAFSLFTLSEQMASPSNENEKIDW